MWVGNSEGREWDGEGEISPFEKHGTKPDEPDWQEVCSLGPYCLGSLSTHHVAGTVINKQSQVKSANDHVKEMASYI